MSKKLIKLINDERLNAKITSAKADCSGGAVDICTVSNYDNADCSTYAYDKCGKDYSACYDGADDVCTNVDADTPCSGAGVEDYN